jgi:hypothetical protein
MFTLAENVAHNLCNSNNTAPSIGIIRVTIYVANEKVRFKSNQNQNQNQIKKFYLKSVHFITITGACANEIIPNG